MFTAIKKWLHRMFGKTEEKTVQPVKTKKKLSRADKKQIEAAIALSLIHIFGAAI